LVRAAAPGEARPGPGAEVPVEEEGLGVVPDTAEGLPDHRRVLGDERQETRDPRPAARDADRGLGERTEGPAAPAADGWALGRLQVRAQPPQLREEPLAQRRTQVLH